MSRTRDESQQVAKLAELCKLLEQAESQLRALGDASIWSSYPSGAAVAEFVEGVREGLVAGTVSPADKRELWGIFAPTCDWDDTVGGVELGTKIFPLIEALVWKPESSDR